MADGVGNLFVWTGEADITYSVADSGWEFMSGYYPLALQQIADNPWGEAMMPRLRIRLLNGSNYFVDSDGFFSSPDWPDTGNLINVQSTPSGDPEPFGTSTLLITNATATTAEYIYQSRTLEDRDRFVFWVLVHVYSTGAGTLRLSHYDETTGASTDQYADFDWTAGVPSLTTLSDADAAGVEFIEEGWYKCWVAGRTEGNGGSKGNTHTWRVYPSQGDSTAGQGIYMSHAQLEMGASGGPRTATNYTDGPWGTVETGATNVTDGAPGELVTVNQSSTERVLRVNPVTVKRERRFGVVEGQQWQATVSDPDNVLTGYELAGCPICLEMGFEEADEWALLAQGVVNVAKTNTSNVITIDVDDPMRQLLDGKLARWVFFHEDAQASDVYDIERSDSSESYDMDAAGLPGVEITNTANVVEQKWVIEFTSATAFKLIEEDGTEHTGYTITNDVVRSADGFTLHKDGWLLGTGDYATGDRFGFSLSRDRGASNVLSPVQLLIELLTDELFLNLSVYNVINGFYYSSPLYDYTASWQARVTTYSGTTMKGQWDEGEDTLKLVHGILKTIHASIYTMPTGQLRLWETRPNEVDAVTFNGDPERGSVEILAAEQTDSLEDRHTTVRYKYRHLADGSPASLESSDPNAGVRATRALVVDLENWRVDSGSVDAAVSKALTRLKDNRRAYSLRTTLKGAVIGIDTPIHFVEPMLNTELTTLVRIVTVDVDANEARLHAQIDPVVLEDYAVVGDATTDPVGSTVGDTAALIF